VISAVLTVAMLCSIVAAAVHPPPVIPDDFTAHITVQEFTGPKKASAASMVMFSDSQNKRVLSVTNEMVGDSGLTAFVHDLHLYQTAENYVYSSALSQCTSKTEAKAAFPVLFNWLTRATFGGQTTVANRLVNVWVLNDKKKDVVLSLYAAGNTPVRLTQFVGAANTTVVLDFDAFVEAVPDSNIFAVPEFCPKPQATIFAAVRTRTAHLVHAAMIGDGPLGIHWKCDICKIAAEAIISAGCGAGSAVCGPFAEVCEAMCEDGCTAAGCGDWACKKFGFC